LSNDVSYEKALALQLENSFRKNDILIAFSASGSSINIIESIICAQNCSADVYSFTGFDGGKIQEINGINKIHINSKMGKYGEIENIHLMICHYIIDSICKKFN
jgi:D-sedoheptulose 7-phosphate isomerase